LVRGHDDAVTEIGQIGDTIGCSHCFERVAVAGFQFNDFDRVSFDSWRIGSGGAFWVSLVLG